MGRNASYFSQSKPPFWLLHCAGWITYTVIFVLDNVLFRAQNTQPHSLVLMTLAISGSIAAILTLPLRNVYRRCWNLSAVKLITVMAICSLFVAAIWTPAKNIVMWYFLDHYNVFADMKGQGEEEFKLAYLFVTGSYSFFMVLVWSSMYFGINYHYRLLEEKQQHLDAVRLSHSAQIKMLRYQINPHFLFNTLNAISTLVLKGAKEKANGMLARLSTFLRYSLDNDPEKKIRLYEELKALMLYLEIEKVRFDERLTVNFNVEERTEALLVPSLILQPLVENSIKYALSKMVRGGVIQISAQCINNLLRLEVADNGPDGHTVVDTLNAHSPTNQSGGGVGIRNVQERLSVLYPGQYHFNTIKNNPAGLLVRIEIPIEEA